MRHSQDTWRLIAQGALLGVLAGLAFALVEVLTSVARGHAPEVPLRMAASVVLGREALDPLAPAVVRGVGILVHLGLSVVFGALYGAILPTLTGEVREGVTSQALVGLGFGVFLWLVNFQLIARTEYPWLLGTPQVTQAAIHAACFGLPIAMGFAAHERRLRRRGDA
ncbi:MAG TPA: hypothetical protein VGQ83_42320 [Polyangia bacterium]|jgi:uncharacterized membrane protein YagU involved in acid resistance